MSSNEGLVPLVNIAFGLAIAGIDCGRGLSLKTSGVGRRGLLGGLE